jgi:YesN/AraC family two-component response regulator
MEVVGTANTGSEALRVITSCRPDIAVVDFEAWQASMDSI